MLRIHWSKKRKTLCPFWRCRIIKKQSSCDYFCLHNYNADVQFCRATQGLRSEHRQPRPCLPCSKWINKPYDWNWSKRCQTLRVGRGTGGSSLMGRSIQSWRPYPPIWRAAIGMIYKWSTISFFCLEVPYRGLSMKNRDHQGVHTHSAIFFSSKD